MGGDDGVLRADAGAVVLARPGAAGAAAARPRVPGRQPCGVVGSHRGERDFPRTGLAPPSQAADALLMAPLGLLRRVSTPALIGLVVLAGAAPGHAAGTSAVEGTAPTWANPGNSTGKASA